MFKKTMLAVSLVAASIGSANAQVRWIFGDGVQVIDGGAGAAAEPVLPEYQSGSPWYTTVSSRVAARNFMNHATAKNVILFVGDGMGPTTVTAARIFDGQNEGKLGEEHELTIDTMPWTGLSKTYNVDAQTPDSAGTMTAMMSGVKTDVGVIGVDEDIVRGDCSTVAGNELVTALELAEIAGMSTGVIATARITHATPAATYAKSADRNWEDNSDMPEEAIAAGCEDIASQLVYFEDRLEERLGVEVDGIEIAMGGGRRHFLPRDAAFNVEDVAPDVEGDRTDGRDLTAEWLEKYPDGVVVMDQDDFDTIPVDATRVLGLFNESHMQYEGDRANDRAGEPSIAEMTGKAIDILSKDDDGFFLMVESGRIDHAHHAGNAWGALTDTVAFDEAIKAAIESVDLDETLIIVTADHDHSVNMNGYAQRGNPILGHLVPVGETEPYIAADGLPYTVLGYLNGRGFYDLGVETNSDAGYGIDQDLVTRRHDTTFVDVEAPGYHQEALVALSSETHAGGEVAIYAIGAGAHRVIGTNEQNVMYHVMEQAADLEDKAAEAAAGTN